MDYEQLEIDLSNLLQGQFFECKPLPDHQVDYSKSFTPHVYVTYDNSEYAETENLNAIIQEDKLRIGFEMHSRTRTGEQGIFAIQKIVFQKILGYKIPGCDKLQLVSFGPLAGSGPNNWMYYAQFNTISHVSESENVTEGPLLKQITFIPPDENI